MLSCKLVTVGINTCMRITEITPTKPPSPEKARIDALTKQKERANDALKAERDRQKRQKAVTQMRDAQKAVQSLVIT